MAGPTLLRVKRRKNDDPSEVLVLSAKKRKTDATSGPEDEEGNSIKILKLAATIDASEAKSGEKLTETVSKILAKKNHPNFEELKQKYKKSLSKSSTNVSKDAKEKVAASRQENKFRLVSQKRSLKVEELEEWPEEESQKSKADEKVTTSSTNELFHLYDVVSDDLVKPDQENNTKKEKISCNGVEMIREYVDAQKSEEDYGYVYDVYYTDGIDGKSEVDVDYIVVLFLIVYFQDFDDSLLDNLVSIHPFLAKDDLFDEYRDDPDEFKYEDDVDSNDEFNERNEYPDEDDESDDDERYYRGYGDDEDVDLGSGMRGLGLASSEDDGLSSDDEDQLLYTKSYEEDDANRSGIAYARFKKQMMKEFYDAEDDEDD